MHEGLHQQIAQKRARAARGQARLDEGRLNPPEQHELQARVNVLDLELVELAAAANQGELLRGKMESELEEMRSLKPMSAELTLAIRAAETALWRFGIHLGTPSGKEASDG